MAWSDRSFIDMPEFSTGICPFHETATRVETVDGEARLVGVEAVGPSGGEMVAGEMG